MRAEEQVHPRADEPVASRTGRANRVRRGCGPWGSVADVPRGCALAPRQRSWAAPASEAAAPSLRQVAVGRRPRPGAALGNDLSGGGPLRQRRGRGCARHARGAASGHAGAAPTRQVGPQRSRRLPRPRDGGVWALLLAARRREGRPGSAELARSGDTPQVVSFDHGRARRRTRRGDSMGGYL